MLITRVELIYSKYFLYDILGIGIFIKFFEELYKIVMKKYLAEPEGKDPM